MRGLWMVWCVVWLMPGVCWGQGTHFFGEVVGGASLPLGTESERLGWAVGVTAGVGGKVPDTPLRLYAVGQTNYATFDVLEWDAKSGEELAFASVVVDVEVGGRALIPLGHENVRLFADVMVGLAWVERELETSEGERVYVRDVQPRLGLFTGLGIQYRPWTFFSAGLKADFGLLAEGEVPETEGLSGRMNVMATATVHF